LSDEAVKKIKKLNKQFHLPIAWVDKRAFWILCYCYFVNGKDEVIRWKQLEKTKLMASEALSLHLNHLWCVGYLSRNKTNSGTFYKLREKAKQAIEQELSEAELLLQLRNVR
jgi:hypothetical protein